jgi:hypothetical protein
MKRVWLYSAVAFVGLALLLDANVYSAEIVKDQHWPANSDGVWEFGGPPIGNVLDVGLSGKLIQIDLYLTKRFWPPQNPIPVGDLYWELRSVKDGLPEAFSVLPLASGVVLGTSITFEPLVTIDLTAEQLFVESGQQIGLCLTGSSGIYQWLSYRGTDAPQNRSFFLTGIGWQKFPIDRNPPVPPYSAGYSTYVELVPEPSGTLLALVGGLMLSLRIRAHDRLFGSAI